MDKLDKIRDKIKKLFALSKSPNAHEAAHALEMAQKFMGQYQIDWGDINFFDVADSNIQGNSGEKPPKYELSLSVSIGKAFGCKIAYGAIKTDCGWRYGHTYIGIEHRVKIAAFILEVLLRQLKRARAEYVKSLYRVRSRGTKIRRADEFCLGWVVTVIDKVQKFTNTPEEQSAIDKYREKMNWGGSVSSLSRKAVKGYEWQDYFNGKRAASGVQIKHGVDGGTGGIRCLNYS
jgi:hypothetical protein